MQRLVCSLCLLRESLTNSSVINLTQLFLKQSCEQKNEPSLMLFVIHVGHCNFATLVQLMEAHSVIVVIKKDVMMKTNFFVTATTLFVGTCPTGFDPTLYTFWRQSYK